MKIPSSHNENLEFKIISNNFLSTNVFSDGFTFLKHTQCILNLHLPFKLHLIQYTSPKYHF